VKVSNEGTVVLGEGVKGIEGMKVGIDGGGTVRLMKDVAFNNGAEAGIKIEGSKGNASVIGVGKTVIVKGSGIEVDGNGGTASVVGLTIKGTGSTGVGVDVQNGREMTLNKVEVSGFTVGVNAKNGTVNINGNSTIEVIANGTGIMVSGSGATADLTKVTIKGTGSGMYGVRGTGGTVTLNMVNVSGVQKGVEATGGKLNINMGSINFTGVGSYGVKVGSGATAELMGTKIMGTSGQGTGVIKEGTGEMTMNMVTIEGVGKGVEVKNGTVKINMGSITFESGVKNYGVHVQNGASAIITGATITGKGSGQGTGVHAMGTTTMNMVNISNVAMGVGLQKGNLTVNGGTMTGVQTGITMSGSGTLKISGGTTITVKDGGTG
ncbi:hypothetical protein, partial [Bartonella bovis]|uniref:hypothetical protein n=1 Tax=Bartonella bovis TaxID=155194 RepID=UPI001304B8FA